MTRLHELFERQGQSPWLDNLERSYLKSGRLARYVADGVRGVTSNPTILAKAIEAGRDYDEQFADLMTTCGTEEAYWELVAHDIAGASEVLAPVHRASEGVDGFVSVEVSPALAHDTQGTVGAARSLHRRIDRPNVFVKIPATREGVPAIRQMISEGRNTNVTLIFGLERYEEVIEAYLAGLEELSSSGGDLSKVSSVASFFVSRVDTNVDRRLASIAESSPGPTGDRALEMRGRAAVAQAKLAYELFLARFSGARWELLERRGARPQRPLWASTSTKNPAYPDLLYVDNLIGPSSVNTMPDATIAHFLDHGRVGRTVDTGLEEARACLAGLAEIGVDLDEVTETLEDEGVASFAKSFDEVIQALSDKARLLEAP